MGFGAVSSDDAVKLLQLPFIEQILLLNKSRYSCQCQLTVVD